jgi:hypothetical protein
MGRYWCHSLVTTQMVWLPGYMYERVGIHLAHIAYDNTNRPAQLSPLASRPDHLHPLPQFRHRIHSLSPPSGEHPRSRAILQYIRVARRTKTASALFHQCRPSHGISPLGRGSGRVHLRSKRAGMGQAPSISPRYCHNHYQLRVGGRIRA